MHALIDQVKLSDAEQQKRFRGALGQAARLADTLMGGANHNEIEKTADAYQRMKSLLDLAKTRLPKEVSDAPQQARPSDGELRAAASATEGASEGQRFAKASDILHVTKQKCCRAEARLR